MELKAVRRVSKCHKFARSNETSSNDKVSFQPKSAEKQLVSLTL